SDPKVMRLPANKSEGDIPHFAIETGGADPFECLFRKIGVNDSEFTDPSGKGRINLFHGNTPVNQAGILPPHPAQKISSSTPTTSTFRSTAKGLLHYDMIINACEGREFPQDKPQAHIDNLVAYANAGGRLFNTHFSYFWLDPTVTTSEMSPWTVSG